ncbi:hypothetical protein TNIN_484061 [Trichonephila inaurata madagascariensis]|uniref:Uncharacterized protein n=1 Tax=Trichonephila inaurata madagascariensis TaxID=2747483 RepID=A0A8X6WYG8_9ARAC|nr:hypothetical protein TNIN_484061 [Trichonephila inaurata madagascariensis]
MESHANEPLGAKFAFINNTPQIKKAATVASSLCERHQNYRTRNHVPLVTPFLFQKRLLHPSFLWASPSSPIFIYRLLHTFVYPSPHFTIFR